MVVVYESLNCIGRTPALIKFTRVSEVHLYNTRYSSQYNYYNTFARTTRYGLRSLQIEGGNIWSAIVSFIQDCGSKKIIY